MLELVRIYDANLLVATLLDEIHAHTHCSGLLWLVNVETTRPSSESPVVLLLKAVSIVTS